MSITRRPLGHGSQPQPPAAAQLETGSVRRMSAAEADINAALLYRPGGLEHLAQLRERGVLGSSDQPA
ncbi:hypothetical protein ACH4VS_39150 [Streptomyces hygroscopicus]|uniref:hypothetical protein n=1 Tax=Streptomyces hygroscopicus TaxID=1912 RepID=UPI000AB26E38|nr:hypothetical protein [Streptomyces hygroscopicus]GLV79787.1 hypothetical protein Shyhy02_77870 [Streptomyces hygroscopicus subsp. hygroscopicus]